ncbi:MAG: hypothetical protein Q9M23_03870 [Mariprofundaceae bacterium]|nr:hypothetical protein [Mariprofundaceae bacterium]
MAEGETNMKALFYASCGSLVGALTGMVLANSLVNFSDADATRSGGYVAISMALLFGVIGYRQGKIRKAND